MGVGELWHMTHFLVLGKFTYVHLEHTHLSDWKLVGVTHYSIIQCCTGDLVSFATTSLAFSNKVLIY